MNKDMKNTFDKYMCDKLKVKEKIDNIIINKKSKNNFKLIVPVSVFSLIIMFFLINFYINTPYSYISIDINPSIVLKTNRINRVIGVEGLNDDGKSLINNINLKHKTINDANTIIIEKAIEHGYIDKNIDSNAILVSVYCNDKKVSLDIEKNINTHLHNCLDAKGINSLIIEQSLTKEDVENLENHNVSHGKIKFIKKAMEENPELKYEDLIDLPVREIAKYIKGYENISPVINEHNHNENEHY